MSQFNSAVQTDEQGEQDGMFMASGREILDYDEQPYGDDNVLVRSMKRRSFLVSALEL